MTYLVTNVLHLAAARGLDQKVIGKAAGVAQSTISRIYNNKIGDTGYLGVQKLAAFFGVTMDDLVNRNIAENGVSSKSQTGRPDLETLASAMEFLGLVSQRQVVPIDFSTDSEALLYAYDLIAQDPAGFDHEQAMGQMVEWLKARRLGNAKVDKGDADRPRGRGVRKG